MKKLCFVAEKFRFCLLQSDFQYHLWRCLSLFYGSVADVEDLIIKWKVGRRESHSLVGHLHVARLQQ